MERKLSQPSRASRQTKIDMYKFQTPSPKKQDLYQMEGASKPSLAHANDLYGATMNTL